MPIYEFYCAACHTVFSFFSPRVDTESHPACPRCGEAELPRKPSTFATVKRTGGGEGGEGEGGDGDDLLAGLDEARLEGAMESVMGELEAAGEEEDPRQMARLLRRFGDAAGMEPGPRMEEMLRRLEAGEAPDALEDELGGDLADEDSGLEEFFRLKQAAASGRRPPPPRVDEELYFL
jgi:putative FmdB family regulatory protein